jgi:uncharacterized protein (DUF952 family)
MHAPEHDAGAAMTRIIATTESARDANIAYHLVPVDVWQQQQSREFYVPEAYEADGFIHLTLGADEMLAVANRFYTGDPRDFLIVELDLGRVAADVRYEDPDRIYPHIYGELNTDAVTGFLGIERDASGAFTRIVTDAPVS